MKYSLRLFVLGICSVVAMEGHAQQINLSELATGTIRDFGTLYDEENETFFGYYMLSLLEAVDRDHERYEYVLFDKNLNEFANGQFTDPKINVNKRVAMFMKAGTVRFISNTVFYSALNPGIPQYSYSHYRDIDLRTNEVSPIYYEYQGRRKLGYLKSKKEVKKIFYGDKSYNHTIPGKGYLHYKYEKIKRINKTTEFAFYNKDSVKQWEIDVNGPEAKKYWWDLRVVSNEDDLLIMDQNKYKNGSITHNDLVAKEIGTGNTLFEYKIYNREKARKDTCSYGGFSYKSLDNNDFSLVRMVLNKEGAKVLGFERVVLDTDNGAEKQRKRFLWNQAKAFIEIKDDGRVDKNYELIPKRFFLFKDGRVGVLTEKTKDTYNLLLGYTQKSTDFVILLFDQDFELSKIETITKAKTKGYSTDYLFSQYVENDQNLYFFYRDFIKDSEARERKWILGIVKVTAEGIGHEQIDMSSEDHALAVMRAKEGYILIREYNRSIEHNQVRLEKLN